MITATSGVRGLKPLMLGARIPLGLVATSIVALALILINLGGAQQSAAFAATQATGELSPLTAVSELSGDELSVTDSLVLAAKVGATQ